MNRCALLFIALLPVCLASGCGKVEVINRCGGLPLEEAAVLLARNPINFSSLDNVSFYENLDITTADVVIPYHALRHNFKLFREYYRPYACEVHATPGRHTIHTFFYEDDNGYIYKDGPDSAYKKPVVMNFQPRHVYVFTCDLQYEGKHIESYIDRVEVYQFEEFAELPTTKKYLNNHWKKYRK